MPKRGIIALTLTTVALVLLLSFKTPDDALPVRGGGAAVADVGANPTVRPRATAQPPATVAPGATPAPTPTAANGGGTAPSATVDGPVVSTRYGDVQVEVSVAGGRLKDVVALQLPTDRRSGQISRAVEPILHQEALLAQSASIDIVSGATYTSDAYARSLQAALDQAGL
ncbi:MAG: FMN-binding protein [Chloroflexota bacterium]